MRSNDERRGIRPMSKRIASILVCGALGLIFSSEVQAMPVSPAPAHAVTPLVTPVRGFCGLGFHRGPYGYCVHNGVPYGYLPPPPPRVVGGRTRARSAFTWGHTATATSTELTRRVGRAWMSPARGNGRQPLLILREERYGRESEGNRSSSVSNAPPREGILLKSKPDEFISLALSVLAVCVTAASLVDAQQTWTQAGMLRCALNPSIGFVIFGHQSMECKFQPVSGPVQAYEDGAINTVGIDLGISGGGRFAWAVFGSASGIPNGALAGEYVGASGDIGLGVGVGANALVGGSNRSVALQPVSLEGSMAVNAVAGLSQLKFSPPCANVTVILAADAIYLLEAARLSGMLKCGGLARRGAPC